MHTNLMSTFITNLHSYSIPKSYQTHHIQPMNHSIHATSLKTCFNTIIQLNMWPSSKNREVNKTRTHSRLALAQVEGSRSGELPSPRRELEKGNNGVVALSRLGETSSPERDGLSLKIGARRLSDSSCNTWVGFLILSLRRDPLAWTRLSNLRHCSRKPAQKLSRARHNTCSY